MWLRAGFSFPEARPLSYNMPVGEEGGSTSSLPRLQPYLGPQPHSPGSSPLPLAAFPWQTPCGLMRKADKCQTDTKAVHQAEPPATAEPTFSLLFEVLVLIQEADVGLRAQRDVVLISPVVTATVLLLLLRSSLASSL